MQNLSTEQACFISVKAREFHVKVEPVIPDPASNPSEDDQRMVLSNYGDSIGPAGYSADSTEQELTAALENLNVDALSELVALLWLGRGDFAADGWSEAVAQAQELCDPSTIRMLIETPLLGDLIEEGLSQLGFSCEEFETDRL